MKSLIVTEKQLDVIKCACELYGRIQIGQFQQFAEIVTQTGFSGWGMRVKPERIKDETDESYRRRCNLAEEQDMIKREIGVFRRCASLFPLILSGK